MKGSGFRAAAREYGVESPLVSVIVPVYKAESYIRRCLDSIVGQAYRNIEVLLIDDGSPDRSGDICDEYAVRDPRVIVFHQNNQGVSAARNFALDIAKGKYFLFVDSDDYIDQALIGGLVSAAEDARADIVFFDHCEVTEEGCVPFASKWYPGISTDELKRQVVADEIYNAPWAKLFHRETWGGFRFPKGMVYEDLYIMPSVVVNAGRLLYLPLSVPGYFYECSNLDSITSPVRDIKARNRYDMFLAFGEHSRVAEEMGWEDIVDWAETKAVQNAIRALYANEALPEISEEKIEFALSYLEARKRSVKNLSLKYRVLYWLLFSAPPAFKLYGSLRLAKVR